MAAGLIFVKPLAYALGSTDTILPYTVSYLRIILIGAPAMTSYLVLNNQMRFQGSAFYAMIGIVSGAEIFRFYSTILSQAFIIMKKSYAAAHPPCAVRAGERSNNLP